MQVIDYSDLSKHVSWKQAIEADFGSDKPEKLNVWQTLRLAAAFTIPFIVITIISRNIVMLFITLGIYLLIIYVFYDAGKSIIRYKAFAAKNGFKYQTSFKQETKGVLKDLGTSYSYSDLFECTLDGNSFSFYDVNFREKRQKRNSNDPTSFGIIEFRLSQKFPNLFLDAKKNNAFSLSASLLKFGNRQKYELEGTFNNYFSLYVEPSFESDALYLLTPDVMQSIVAKMPQYDIELIEDVMRFYIYPSISKMPKDLQEMFEAIVHIQKDILHNISHATTHYDEEEIKYSQLNKSSSIMANLMVYVIPIILLVIIGLAIANTISATN